jgi:hypothetical protein
MDPAVLGDIMAGLQSSRPYLQAFNHTGIGLYAVVWAANVTCAHVIQHVRVYKDQGHAEGISSTSPSSFIIIVGHQCRLCNLM